MLTAPVGCAGDDGSTTEAATTAAPAVRTCTSRAFRFAVEYPADWFTPRDKFACLFFHPTQIEIPENTDFTGAAVEVLPAQDSFANVVRGYTDARFTEVTARADTRVAGRPAVRLEGVETGEGLYDLGTKVYLYVVDRQRRAFVVQATTAAGVNFDASKRVVDSLARTLRFTGQPPAQR